MTVLVSYIPTPEGWVALGEGIEQAGFRQTDLVVVNVAVGDKNSDVTFADEKDLDAVKTRLDELGIAHSVEQVLGARDVADAVLAAAHAHDVDLIVVGLRRRSAVGKAVFGSNAQNIIVAADCPVMSVRPAAGVSAPSA
jgi:nucleotide-binding universal stress UspA family protein